jgi:hypothetical protein
MKSSSILLLLALSLLAGCGSQEQVSSQSSIVGDEMVLAELEFIIPLSQMNEENMVPLMPMDLDMLNQSVASDPVASHYLEELYYMLEHNGSDHVAHTVDFLETYLKTGQKYVCTPHELWHATLYIKGEDFDLIEHAIEDAQSSLPLWESDSREKQKRFPQFYLRLDEQIAESEYLIEQLYQKNYSSAMIDRLSYLGETASC